MRLDGPWPCATVAGKVMNTGKTVSNAACGAGFTASEARRPGEAGPKVPGMEAGGAGRPGRPDAPARQPGPAP